ncbi:enterochelin esterase [Celerinatantimonas sp. MCCC 1A17872]|uniref:enterochelin esterase n=1 Tax=Celerinatantimonas sp. MCCC 1A17872 TaxID=3177514 RepID=UPI0038BF09F5
MQSDWFKRPDLGEQSWWDELKKIGTPLIEQSDKDDGTARVSFIWQDPEPDAKQSNTQRVWLNLTGVNDHHQCMYPQSLERIGQTDVWALEMNLNRTYRGSYVLMPSSQDSDYQGPADDMLSVRTWWQSIFSHAQADPLNHHRSWTGGRGIPSSALHMPDAPDQSIWQSVDEGANITGDIQLTQHHWNSALLENSRRVWTLCFGQSTNQRPLAIILDGAFWIEQMPLPIPLSQLTKQSKLPSDAVYLFIDSVNSAQRAQELPCNPTFWQAVQHELLPQIKEHTPYSQDPERTIIAGQSFGGLASAYATLKFPSIARNAICQSSSFWWPKKQKDNLDGTLLSELEQHQFSRLRRRFFIESGNGELLIQKANQHVIELLKAQGHALISRTVTGGHDAMCWRGGLTDGLCALWAN